MFPSFDPFIRWLDDLKDLGLEYAADLFYSNYVGEVEENKDPQQQGRVKVSVGNLGHNSQVGSGAAAAVDAHTLELYAYPSSPFAGDNYGVYFPPEPGDNVWVWFDHGNTTQPHYGGSYWRNKTEQPSQAGVTKPAVSSSVPVEFNSVTNTKLKTGVVASSGPPDPFAITTRGIKTKGGHGLVFEDDKIVSPGVTSQGRETRVELWTGQPAPSVPTQAGQIPAPVAAIKRHRFNMSDALANITITSNGPTVGTNLGHSTVWDDRPVSQGVRTTTTYKHVIDANDVTKAITISTPLKYSYVASDLLQSIVISTPGLMSFTMNDQEAFIEIGTKAQQFVTMDDTALELSIITPGSYFNVSGPLSNMSCAGSTFITSGATVTITAGGLLTIQAQGISITSNGPAVCSTISGGAVNNTFVGLVTENLQGGYTQNVTGIWDVTADIAGIISTQITLGSLPKTKFFLVTDAFLDYYNNHTHAATMGLGPPDPAFQIVPPTSPLAPIPDPAVSPKIDERLVLTQETQAS